MVLSWKNLDRNLISIDLEQAKAINSVPTILHKIRYCKRFSAFKLFFSIDTNGGNRKLFDYLIDK